MVSVSEDTKRPGPYHYINKGETSPTVQTYQLKHIKPRHREIARRVLIGNQNLAEIARDLGMSAHAMYLITNSDLFKLELKRLEEMRERSVIDISQQLEEVSPQALDVLEKTMVTSQDEKLKVVCAKDLLDRAGYGAVQKNLNVNMDTSRLPLEAKRKLLVERTERMRREAEDRERERQEAATIDVEWEEDTNPEEPEDKISIATG